MTDDDLPDDATVTRSIPCYEIVTDHHMPGATIVDADVKDDVVEITMVRDTADCPACGTTVVGVEHLSPDRRQFTCDADCPVDVFTPEE